MVRLYNSHHHDCFFYLASILVDEYGSENDCIGGLISMLEALLSRAFQLLQEPQLHKVSATIRSFFPS
jgi:transportin-3